MGVFIIGRGRVNKRWYKDWYRLIIGLTMRKAFAFFIRLRPLSIHIYIWGKHIFGIGSRR